MPEKYSDWGVIFDIDGTMVDNAAYHRNAWIEFAQRRDLDLDARFYDEHMHAHSNDRITQVLRARFPGELDDVDIPREKERIYRETYRPHLVPTPGLLACLAGLAEAGIPCTAASNSPPGNVNMVIDGLGIRHHFRAVFTPSAALPGKPAPGMLLAAARAMDLPITRCLVFEDSESGFRAAEAAAAPYVAITGGANPACLTAATRPVARHTDFTDLSASRMASYLAAVPPASALLEGGVRPKPATGRASGGRE